MASAEELNKECKAFREKAAAFSKEVSAMKDKGYFVNIDNLDAVVISGGPVADKPVSPPPSDNKDKGNGDAGKDRKAN